MVDVLAAGGYTCPVIPAACSSNSSTGPSTEKESSIPFSSCMGPTGPRWTSDSVCRSGWPSSRIVAVAFVPLSWIVCPGLILCASNTRRDGESRPISDLSSGSRISELEGTAWSERRRSTRLFDAELCGGSSNDSIASGRHLAAQQTWRVERREAAPYATAQTNWLVQVHVDY